MTRKETILEAAIELFAERGFHATPTSEVAKRAGVSDGVIFYYFKTKEGILLHILEDMMDIYIQGMEAQVKKAGNGLEAIDKLICFHFRFSEERSKELLVLIRDFPFDLMRPGSPHMELIIPRFSRIMDIMKECLRRGQKDGSVRELPAEKTAIILRGMLNGLSRLKLLGPFEIPDLSSEVIDFCYRGLARR